jgi:hypothetical protein
MTPETIVPPEEQSVTLLGASILADAQELIKQQVALARAELKADFRQTVRAATLLISGVAVTIPAMFLLANICVYLLHELGGLPVWAGNAIVGGVLAALSAMLIAVGLQRFRSINPVPDQTVEAFKENVRWMTTPK